MEKDFDHWNIKKKELEKQRMHFLFKTGDIWWCAVGLNVKAESCGKGTQYQRPVLIIKKLSHDLFVGIPISTQKKIGSWFTEITVHGQKRYALLYQIRTFSTIRFQRRFAALEQHDLKKVKEKLEQLLELCNHHQGQSSGSVGIPKK